MHHSPTSPTSRTPFDEDAEEVFEKEKQAIEKSGVSAHLGRGASSGNGREAVRARWDADKFAPLTNVRAQKHDKDAIVDSDEQPPSIWSVMLSIYPSVPRKSLMFFGLVTCCLSGAMTPIFSFLLSRVLFEVSIGAQDVSTINKFGGILVGIAAIDGILLGPSTSSRRSVVRRASRVSGLWLYTMSSCKTRTGSIAQRTQRVG